jgi:colanic acid/amylovoran biosynthesis glycosyltransferase
MRPDQHVVVREGLLQVRVACRDALAGRVADRTRDHADAVVEVPIRQIRRWQHVGVDEQQPRVASGRHADIAGVIRALLGRGRQHCDVPVLTRGARGRAVVDHRHGVLRRELQRIQAPQQRVQRISEPKNGTTMSTPGRSMLDIVPDGPPRDASTTLLAVSRDEVVHIVRNYGVLSETWIPEGIEAVQRFGWQPWILPTGRIEAGAERLGPPRSRWLAPQPPGTVRRLLDVARGRTVANRRSASLVGPLRTIRPGVAHAHFGWTAAEARLAAHEAGVPLVATFHGSDLTVYPGHRRAWDYGRLFRGIAEVIVVSEFLARKLPRYGFRRRAHVIPMGIALDALPFRGALTQFDAPRVLYVGRLIGFKGADVLLRSVPLVRAQVPEATFQIIGDGPLRAHCEDLHRSLGLDGPVTLRGALPRAEVYAELAKAHVVVVPSRDEESGRAEARSVLAMEAMAIGAPVVATDNRGLPETIPPEHRGDLARQGDPEALAAALVERITRPETWQSRAEVAHAWVEREFAWPRIAERIADVYAEAAGGRP